MSAGFTTYETNGSVSFSSTDSTWTILYTALVPAGTNSTFSNVPVMSSRVVTRQMLDQVTGDDEAYIHNYSLSGGVLTVTAPSATDTVATFLVVYGK